MRLPASDSWRIPLVPHRAASPRPLAYGGTAPPASDGPRTSAGRTMRDQQRCQALCRAGIMMQAQRQCRDGAAGTGRQDGGHGARHACPRRRGRSAAGRKRLPAGAAGAGREAAAAGVWRGRSGPDAGTGAPWADDEKGPSPSACRRSQSIYEPYVHKICGECSINLWYV